MLTDDRDLETMIDAWKERGIMGDNWGPLGGEGTFILRALELTSHKLV